MAEVILNVQGLAVSRDAFQLEVPSFTVNAGEVSSLIGPSGCGKSSFLLALAGFLPLKNGIITRQEISIESLPPEVRQLAFIFQSGSLFPHLNVEENVAFALKVKGVEKKERLKQITQWLENLEIAHLRKRAIHEISGGEAQRVQLARAFVTGFPLILLDEPFHALDVTLRKQLRALFKKWIREARRGAILVTHDAEDVQELADTVYVMEKGKVIYSGTATEARQSSLALLKEIYR